MPHPSRQIDDVVVEARAVVQHVLTTPPDALQWARQLYLPTPSNFLAVVCLIAIVIALDWWSLGWPWATTWWSADTGRGIEVVAGLGAVAIAVAILVTEGMSEGDVFASARVLLQESHAALLLALGIAMLTVFIWSGGGGIIDLVLAHCLALFTLWSLYKLMAARLFPGQFREASANLHREMIARASRLAVVEQAAETLLRLRLRADNRIFYQPTAPHDGIQAWSGLVVTSKSAGRFVGIQPKPLLEAADIISQATPGDTTARAMILVAPLSRVAVGQALFRVDDSAQFSPVQQRRLVELVHLAVRIAPDEEVGDTYDDVVESLSSRLRYGIQQRDLAAVRNGLALLAITLNEQARHFLPVGEELRLRCAGLGTSPQDFAMSPPIGPTRVLSEAGSLARKSGDDEVLAAVEDLLMDQLFTAVSRGNPEQIVSLTGIVVAARGAVSESR